jgi:hypothetical protein
VAVALAVSLTAIDTVWSTSCLSLTAAEVMNPFQVMPLIELKF